MSPAARGVSRRVCAPSRPLPDEIGSVHALHASGCFQDDLNGLARTTGNSLHSGAQPNVDAVLPENRQDLFRDVRIFAG